MALVKLKSGQTTEYQRVEVDFNGGSVKAFEDHRQVESYPAFHIAYVSFDDGKVFLEDEPPEDW